MYTTTLSQSLMYLRGFNRMSCEKGYQVHSYHYVLNIFRYSQ